MAVKVTQNKKTFWREKRSQFCFPSKKNTKGIKIEERERGVVADSYVVKVGVERRERDKWFREGYTLLDENDDATASVRVIGRKNARPGVSAIRSQTKESRNPERRR